MATTPWCAGVPARRSSPARSSKRTETDARRARSMICCRRAPPAPLAIRMRSSGRPAFRLSSTGLIPLRMAIRGTWLRQQVEPVVKPVREISHRRDQGNLDDLFIVEMLVEGRACLGRIRRAGRFAGILNGCAFGPAEAAVLPALQGAHLIFRDARFKSGSDVRRRA